MKISFIVFCEHDQNGPHLYVTLSNILFHIMTLVCKSMFCLVLDYTKKDKRCCNFCL